MDDGALLRRYDRDTRSTIHGFDFSPDGEPFGYGTNLGLTAVARNPFWCVGRYAAAESGTTVPPRFQNRTAPVMKRMFLPYRTAPVMKRMFLPYRTAPVMKRVFLPYRTAPVMKRVFLPYRTRTCPPFTSRGDVEGPEETLLVSAGLRRP
ncbi:MAG: hypothetical protein HS102_14945 [Planctomycetia bacterium]|nr:hypothetical protein [Planctomycetia bacterium]MCQ3922560.1 hypothetical protein [Planctomycetota bacterium]